MMVLDKHDNLMDTCEKKTMIRRGLLLSLLFLALACCLPGEVFSSEKYPEPLCFYNTHTGETFRITHSTTGYSASVLRELEYFLRDFRTGETHTIDTGLLDVLAAIQKTCSKYTVYEVISGYRSKKTNDYLYTHTRGVNKNSLHMYGRAIDVRLRGLPTDMLRDLAELHNKGGVGYYPRSDFVHIDTGPKKSWTLR